MTDTIAVIAPGAMGSGIARVLHQAGAEVPTLLQGRSPATAARATAAGMSGATEAEVARAAIILSIVPPAEALGLAQRLRPALADSAHKPVYVDCNAVDVATVRRVAQVFEGTGATFVDGGIIGAPPQPGGSGPVLYLSGSEAGRAGDVLGRLGLSVKLLAGGIGAASALKMSYAGITKGMTALAALMALAATRAGAGDALIEELQASQPHLVPRFARALPDMIPKAYRWVAEMREIAAFLGEDAAGAAVYEGIAQLYERLAQDAAGPRDEAGQLAAFAQKLGAPKQG